MIKALTLLFTLLGPFAARCTAAEPVTLASFIETTPAQSKELKEVIEISFDGASTESGWPILRNMIGGTSILEYPFSAFKKGKIDRHPDFILYLEVAMIGYNKDGNAIMQKFEYPSSFERRIIGFRVVASEESEVSKLQNK